MVSDPRDIHEAKHAVQKRFEGKSTDELALAAAVNSELLLDSWEDHEDRIAALERFRIYVVGGFAVIVVFVVPLVVRLLGGA